MNKVDPENLNNVYINDGGTLHIPHLRNIDLNYQGIPVTGWLCCVCFKNANVDGGGWKMCEKHWRKFTLGHGNKSVALMIKEYVNNED